MGFFSKLKASSDYEKVLKIHGANPHAIPPVANARILSYAFQQHERNVQISPDLDCTSGREAAMQNAGMLVAFCVLGPTSFRGGRGIYEMVTETVEYAAGEWKEYGPEASLETMIIKTLSDAGILNGKFADTFNSML